MSLIFFGSFRQESCPGRRAHLTPEGLFSTSMVFLWSVMRFSYQLNPRGAPPLSVVKTITELSYNPLLLRAFVMFPTDSSNEATIAA